MMFFRRRPYAAVLLSVGILAGALLLLADVQIEIVRSERVLYSGAPEGPLPPDGDPAGLALEVDEEGWAYIVDPRFGAIKVVSPAGDARTALPSGSAPLLSAAVGGWLYVFDAAEGVLTRYCLEDVRAGVTSEPAETLALADQFSAALRAEGAADFPDAPEIGGEVQIDVHRLESAGERLLLLADLISDPRIYRIAIQLPVDALRNGELTAEAEWIYGAFLEEAGEGWRQFFPAESTVEAPLLDICPAGSLHPGGGGVSWCVVFLPEGRHLLWEGIRPVRPDLIGAAPDGDVWLAEWRPRPRAGIPITGYSAEWVFSWVSPGGAVRETVRVPWPDDLRTSPAARSLGESLYILYPAEETNEWTLRVVSFARRWSVELFGRRF